MITWSYEVYRPGKDSTGFVVKCYNYSTYRTMWYHRVYSSEIGIMRALVTKNKFSLPLFSNDYVMFYVYKKDGCEFNLFALVTSERKIFTKFSEIEPVLFESNKMVARGFEDVVII